MWVLGSDFLHSYIGSGVMHEFFLLVCMFAMLANNYTWYFVDVLLLVFAPQLPFDSKRPATT